MSTLYEGAVANARGIVQRALMAAQVEVLPNDSTLVKLRMQSDPDDSKLPWIEFDVAIASDGSGRVRQISIGGTEIRELVEASGKGK